MPFACFHFLDDFPLPDTPSLSFTVDYSSFRGLGSRDRSSDYVPGEVDFLVVESKDVIRAKDSRHKEEGTVSRSSLTD